MTYLKKELEKSIEITDEEWGFISSKFKPKSAKKGEIVHYAGDIFSEVWYIKSGLIFGVHYSQSDPFFF